MRQTWISFHLYCLNTEKVRTLRAILICAVRTDLRHFVGNMKL